MREFFDGRLIIETGDLTQQKVDAIVNAANSSLLGGGGVDGAIHRSGGPDILKACQAIRAKDYPQGLPTGEAVITPGGRLAAPWVIHTVGPVWHGGTQNEDALLEAAYRNSISLAEKQGLASLAFPAISTGVYGFPKDRAARIIATLLKKYWSGTLKPGQEQRPQLAASPPRLKKIHLVYFSAQDADLFIQIAESVWGVLP